MRQPTKNPGGNQGLKSRKLYKVASSLTFAPRKVDSLIDLPWTQERSLTVDGWLLKRSRWEVSHD
jgi:hypothetical protein